MKKKSTKPTIQAAPVASPKPKKPKGSRTTYTPRVIETEIMQAHCFMGAALRQTSTPDDLWFVTDDAGTMLNIKDVSTSIRNFPESEKGVLTTRTLGGKQQVSVINEAGLYRLIFQSRKAEAEAFKTWVFTEVLPSIRRTGKYDAARDHAPAESPPERNALTAKPYFHWLPQTKEDYEIFRRCREAEFNALRGQIISGFPVRETPAAWPFPPLEDLPEVQAMGVWAMAAFRCFKTYFEAGNALKTGLWTYHPERMAELSQQ